MRDMSVFSRTSHCLNICHLNTEAVLTTLNINSVAMALTPSIQLLTVGADGTARHLRRLVLIMVVDAATKCNMHCTMQHARYVRRIMRCMARPQHAVCAIECDVHIVRSSMHPHMQHALSLMTNLCSMQHSGNILCIIQQTMQHATYNVTYLHLDAFSGAQFGT